MTYFIEYFGEDHRGVSYWSCDEHETCESVTDVVRELGDKCPEDPKMVRIRECDEDGRWRWVTDKALRAWMAFEWQHRSFGDLEAWMAPFEEHWPRWAIEALEKRATADTRMEELT